MDLCQRKFLFHFVGVKNVSGVEVLNNGKVVKTHEDVFFAKRKTKESKGK